VAAALEKKALAPVVLDVRDHASYTDFVAIVSGRSDRQVQAIADGVLETLGREGRRPLGVEGVNEGHWALLDFGDFVVHVFHHPMREFYDLEGMWIEVPRLEIDIPPEARYSDPIY
jgi:ribosome-associated protein